MKGEIIIFSKSKMFIIIFFILLLFFLCSLFLLRGCRLQNRYREIGFVNSVPMIIHQVVKKKKIHKDLYRLVRLHHERIPNFTFRYYDNKDIHLLIRENFKPKIYTAFCRIDPIYGACIADFARYCILYLYGGIYLDIKSEIKKNIGELLETMPKKDEMMVYYTPIRDNPHIMSREFILRHKTVFLNDYEFMNWVIVAKPRNNLLYDLIEVISDTILRGINGTGKSFVLHLTGPRMFTSVLLQHDLKNVMINSLFLDFFEYISESCKGSCREKYYSREIDYAGLKKKVLK